MVLIKKLDQILAQATGKSMILIKRYSNRKLYDTHQKKYIALSDVQQMIQSGLEIQVINNDTGDDITSQTLAEIIAGAEKNLNGFLPKQLLMSLVRMGQDRVSSMQQNIYEDYIRSFLNEANIPSRTDIDLIQEQLNQLNEQLDSILNPPNHDNE
jgi:polyhydroxyalkanoate synthesis repressor PhaR